MQIQSTWRNSFNERVSGKVQVLSVSDIPRNVRGRTSEGNWAVDFFVAVDIGNGKQERSQYFWRKVQAIEWIAMVKNS